MSAFLRQYLTVVIFGGAAVLMVSAMLAVVMDLLETDARHPEDAASILQLAERQLRLIVLGMSAWRSKL